MKDRTLNGRRKVNAQEIKTPQMDKGKRKERERVWCHGKVVVKKKKAESIKQWW